MGSGYAQARRLPRASLPFFGWRPLPPRLSSASRRATCCKVRQRTVTPPGRPMPGSIPGSPTIPPRSEPALGPMTVTWRMCCARTVWSACILNDYET